MASQQEWTIGAQQVRFESPDILWVRFQGRLSLEEAIGLVDLYRELGTSSPFFLVGDMREADRVDPEVQRYLSEQAAPAWVHANIFIGARLTHKAVARGIFLAAWLTGRSETNELAKVHFVSSHAEASALVAQLRARLCDKVA
jgi:hypothetical protein